MSRSAGWRSASPVRDLVTQIPEMELGHTMVTNDDFTGMSRARSHPVIPSATGSAFVSPSTMVTNTGRVVTTERNQVMRRINLYLVTRQQQQEQKSQEHKQQQFSMESTVVLSETHTHHEEADSVEAKEYSRTDQMPVNNHRMVLNLSGLSLYRTPREELCNIDHLCHLDLSSNFLSALPRLPSTLQSLNLALNQFVNVPTFPSSVHTIIMHHNNIDGDVDLAMYKNHLEQINLAHNHIHSLNKGHPSVAFVKLLTLDVSHNEVLESIHGGYPHLQELRASNDIKLSSLGDGPYDALQQLVLNTTRLMRLPQQMNTKDLLRLDIRDSLIPLHSLPRPMPKLELFEFATLGQPNSIPLHSSWWRSDVDIKDLETYQRTQHARIMTNWVACYDRGEEIVLDLSGLGLQSLSWVEIPSYCRKLDLANNDLTTESFTSLPLGRWPPRELTSLSLANNTRLTKVPPLPAMYIEFLSIADCLVLDSFSDQHLPELTHIAFNAVVPVVFPHCPALDSMEMFVDQTDDTQVSAVHDHGEEDDSDGSMMEVQAQPGFQSPRQYRLLRQEQRQAQRRREAETERRRLSSILHPSMDQQRKKQYNDNLFQVPSLNGRSCTSGKYLAAPLLQPFSPSSRALQTPRMQVGQLHHLINPEQETLFGDPLSEQIDHDLVVVMTINKSGAVCSYAITMDEIKQMSRLENPLWRWMDSKGADHRFPIFRLSYLAQRIDTFSMMLMHRYNTFVIVPWKECAFGSEYGESRVHGDVEQMYILRPVNRSKMLSEAKFMVETKRPLNDRYRFVPERQDLIDASDPPSQYLEVVGGQRDLMIHTPSTSSLVTLNTPLLKISYSMNDRMSFDVCVNNRIFSIAHQFDSASSTWLTYNHEDDPTQDVEISYAALFSSLQNNELSLDWFRFHSKNPRVHMSLGVEQLVFSVKSAGDRWECATTPNGTVHLRWSFPSKQSIGQFDYSASTMSYKVTTSNYMGPFRLSTEESASATAQASSVVNQLINRQPVLPEFLQLQQQQDQPSSMTDSVDGVSDMQS